MVAVEFSSVKQTSTKKLMNKQRSVDDILTEEHKKKIKYLSQYRYIKSDIDRKIREIEDTKSRIFNITATLSDMPKSTSRSNTIADNISKFNDFENDIKNDLDKLLRTKKSIESKINSIEDLKLREILKCRYIDCKKYEEIAVEKNIDMRWVYRLHEKGLDLIEI